MDYPREENIIGKKINSLIFVSDEFKKNLIYFGIYLFVVLFVQIIFLSVITSFHFLLDHDMSIVENWVYRNGWEITIIVKLLGAYIFYQLFTLRKYDKIEFSKFLKQSFLLPNRTAVNAVVFILFFTTLIGDYSLKTSSIENISSHLLSYLGTFLYYFIDYCFIYYIRLYYPIESNSKRLLIKFLYTLLFGLFTVITLPYASNIDLIILAHFFTLLVLSNSKNFRWWNGALYLLLVVGVRSTFFGDDILWRDEFAIFKYSEEPHGFTLLVIWLIAIGYNFIINKNKIIE